MFLRELKGLDVARDPSEDCSRWFQLCLLLPTYCHAYKPPLLDSVARCAFSQWTVILWTREPK